MGTARVELVLRDGGNRTHVTIEERLVGVMGKIVPRYFTDPLIKLRNAEGLRRLKRLAEEPGFS